MEDFTSYEIYLPVLNLNLLEESTTNMMNQLRFDRPKLENVYRPSFDEFKQKISTLRDDFNKSCLEAKSKLELVLEERTFHLWVSNHVTDHAHLKDVVINEESNCIFHIIPGLQYGGKGGNWISSSEFQKQVLIQERVSSLKFECKDDSD